MVGPTPTARLHRDWPRAIKITLSCLLVYVVGTGVILAFRWPFTKTKVTEDLEHFSSSEVRFKTFHQVYFPHPGYHAEGAEFVRHDGGQPVRMASVSTIRCEAGWISMFLFSHRLRHLSIEGLHVVIPEPVPPAIPFFPSMKDKTTVSTLAADGAVLEIASRRPGRPSWRFEFPKLVLSEVEKQKSIAIDTVARIPIPAGDVAVHGQFGPFTEHQIEATPLSGTYDLRHADLSPTHSIGGFLSSKGSFKGSLAHCLIGGNVRVDGFQIESVHHPVLCQGDFNTELNALKGDAVIRSSLVRFGETELSATGSIEKDNEKSGKLETVDIRSRRARIEDLLRVFTTSNPPALEGPMTLQAHVLLPPGPAPFLRRVQLKGAFDIVEARFIHPKTRLDLHKLSARARGKKDAGDEGMDSHVLSSFAAHVVLKDAIADLSDADFKTPGAVATGGGRYDLLTKQIQLQGNLAMKASLSKAAGGLKSILLIPLDPFFKKGSAGAVLPFRVTGTYSHPEFHVSLHPAK